MALAYHCTVDKDHRGHGAANLRRVFISGQKRGVFGAIERELRSRLAIEPVIGHMKTEVTSSLPSQRP